jgi:hypothetical protein
LLLRLGSLNVDDNVIFPAVFTFIKLGIKDELLSRTLRPNRTNMGRVTAIELAIIPRPGSTADHIAKYRELSWYQLVTHAVKAAVHQPTEEIKGLRY